MFVLNIPIQNKIIGFAILLVLGLSADALAQPGQAKIVVSTDSTLQIELRSASSANAWSFRNVVAGSVGLGERISNFKVSGANVRRITSGEYSSDTAANSCSYTVDLSKPEPGNVAHVSWLTKSNGVLMLADLLPENLGKPLAVQFVLPEGWAVRGVITPQDNQYRITNPEKTVFVVANSIADHARKVDGENLNLFVTGSWPFSNSKALDLAGRVLKHYAALTKYPLKSSVAIIVAPMPVHSSVSQWKAETRGSTIVLLIDPSANFPTWTGQLGVIFVHEVFHLWVPNFLQLKGDFDWFFEGFSLYQGLLTARELKLISSQEMLNTLGRVWDSYLSFSDGGSLIDASERRWANPSSYVYDKGMLVAFMYDLIARTRTDTRSLNDVYSELFASFADKPDDGNEAIIGLLSSSKATQELVERYIRGSARLDFESFLPRFGFRVDTKADRSIISINDNLNDEQRQMMRALGFKR